MTDIEPAIQRELDRGHFSTPVEVVASALRLLSSNKDWLQENREAINERLERRFEQSHNGETYPPSPASPSTSEQRPSCLRARLQPRGKSTPQARGFSP